MIDKDKAGQDDSNSQQEHDLSIGIAAKSTIKKQKDHNTGE